MVGEDGGAAIGAALVHIDEVGARPLGFGQLAPEGLVVLRKPPTQGVGIDFVQCSVLQCLCGLRGVPSLTQRPAARPIDGIVARVLPQLFEAADLDGDRSALAAAFGAEGVITALHWRPKIVHIGVVAVGETTIYQLKGSDEHLRFGPRSLYGQAETASGQQQAGRPG